MTDIVTRNEWSAAGLPEDWWILESDPEALGCWIRSRLLRADGRWNARDGEDPSELVRVLLQSRPWDVRLKLAFAVTAALSTELQATPADGPILELLSLAGDCSLLPPNPATKKLAKLLDAALVTEGQNAVQLRKAMLRARAQLLPPAPTDLWGPYLVDPDLGLAAFQCARFQPDPKERMKAFQLFFKGKAGPFPMQLKSRRELAQLTKLLQQEIEPRVLEDAMRELKKTPDPVGSLAREVSEILWPGQFKFKVAAFVAPDWQKPPEPKC
jgi:hypothetical protein